MCTGAEIAAISAIGGGATSAGGAIAGGFAQKRSSKFNVKIAERKAALDLQQGRFEADRIREAGEVLLKRQLAGFLGAGGVTAEGTPTIVAGKTAEDIELDAQAAIFGGKIGEMEALTKARLEKSRASGALPGAFFEAGSTLLTTADTLPWKKHPLYPAPGN